ncbi:hypothetical protein K3G63_04655 [Hymenobacter sp. HSC-4F20]|uniref:hypothetical protein n=1 Tax=Hymenobacter sp. HSC-4F20 TaxID=2864135 RepID=UPI001C7315BC|nr:hypothetical protein [Hymenobacter sp. HSC-4F20]MBX0289714.1 hypothetical protein [Hymenobacter sp. HSC-4F20]
MPTPSENAAIEKYVGLKMQMQFNPENTDEKVKEAALNTFSAAEIEILKKLGWL